MIEYVQAPPFKPDEGWHVFAVCDDSQTKVTLSGSHPEEVLAWAEAAQVLAHVVLGAQADLVIATTDRGLRYGVVCPLGYPNVDDECGWAAGEATALILIDPHRGEHDPFAAWRRAVDKLVNGLNATDIDVEGLEAAVQMVTEYTAHVYMPYPAWRGSLAEPAGAR